MSTKELSNCLKRMISPGDPISKSSSEKMDELNPEPYLSATKEEILIVYNNLKMKINDPLQSDLLDFLVDIWAYNHAYIKSNELWQRFGDSTETQLIEINVENRHNSSLKIMRFTESKLISYVQQNHPARDWCIGQLNIMNRSPKGSMLLYFIDTKMQKKHGFPFDLHFYHEKSTI